MSRHLRHAAFASVTFLAAACGSSDGAGSPSSAASAASDGGGAAAAATDGTASTSTSATGTAADAGDGAPRLPAWLAGTNLAGLEFNSGALPGRANTDYGVPTHAEVDYFVGKGLGFLRVPLLWERIQPKLGAALDPTYLAIVKDLVTYVSAKGGTPLVDVHNYARWGGKIVGGGNAGDPTKEDLADLWARLAVELGATPRVAFGLMNEPNTMATRTWLADANAAIAAIRGTGAKNVIAVPGNYWTGAHSWTKTDNATVMEGVVDPLDNWVLELHQYLDADSSGTSPSCASADVGTKAIASVTQWLADHGRRAFLGEIGASNDATCLAALDATLGAMAARKDVWAGFTYWAAGPWWGGYMFSVEPKDGKDAPQLATLLRHL